MQEQAQPVIEVRQSTQADPIEFEVIVDSSGTSTRHRVTLSRSDCERLGGGAHPPADCVEAAFLFLLDREPKESILRRFNISDIGRYFPDFDERLPHYLSRVADRRA